MRLAFYNPAAGSSWNARRLRRALDLLRQTSDVRLVETHKAGIDGQVRASLTPDVSAVFACGGDGTVSDVASGLAGSNVPLHIVPSGTTNVLAREFGIPLDPVKAVALASGPYETRRMQTWAVGGRRLVVGVGVGWDARLMYRASRVLKRHVGVLGLGPLSLGLIMAYDFPELRVDGYTADGTRLSAIGTSVLVSNVRYWSGGNPAIRAADPTSEVLQVVVLERSSRLQLAAFWTLMTIPGGNPTGLAGVRMLQFRSLDITAAGLTPIEAHVNGDPVEHTPLTIEPAESVLVAAGRC